MKGDVTGGPIRWRMHVPVPAPRATSRAGKGSRTHSVRQRGSSTGTLGSHYRDRRIPDAPAILALEGKRAMAVVPSEEMSTAVGPNGLNRDLASRLSGYDIEIVADPGGPRCAPAACVDSRVP